MEGNTGFYAVKSNPRTIRTWDLTYRACSLTPLYDDQTMFWLILRNNLNPRPAPLPTCPSTTTSTGLLLATTPSLESAKEDVPIVSCPLNSCVFSAGALRNYETLDRLTSGLRGVGQSAVTVHANWMNGRQKKQFALQSNGLWITTFRFGREKAREEQVSIAPGHEGQIQGGRPLRVGPVNKIDLRQKGQGMERLRAGGALRKRNGPFLRQRRLQMSGNETWACLPISSTLLKSIK